MMSHRYQATQDGSDHWQYANNSNTHNNNTTVFIHGHQISYSAGSSTRSFHLWRDRKRWREWHKKYRWMFVGACVAIVTAVVVLCVLLSRKHSSGTVHPSAVSIHTSPSSSLTDTLLRPPDYYQPRNPTS